MTDPSVRGSSGSSGGKNTESTSIGVGPSTDYFVSRRGADALIAQEVAQVLIDAGYTAFVQDFDIPYTANFLAAIHRALKHCRHFIVLLTKDYDASDFTLAELTNFLAAAARAGGERRLVVLRLEDVAPEGLLAGVVYGDLVGITDPEERKGRILAAAEGHPPTAARQPKIFNVPQRDLNFTGRESRLSKLHQLLMSTEQAPAITQVAIYGLGGIGKTSLAAEYAQRHGGEYAGVWWAPAESRTVLLASLAALAGRLDLRFAEEADQEKAAHAGLAYLARSAVPYLLIYDNVESPDVLNNLLPSAGARVLLTTRWTDWSGRAAEMELDALGCEAAVDLLQKRAGRVDEPGAARLAESLGYLPLALDHAGAYCRLSGVSFDTYREKIDAYISKSPKGAAYPASVAATFGLAIEKAVIEQPAAETMLGFCAFLAPEAIPLDLITGEISDEDECAEALIALTAVSLIQHSKLDGGEPAISLHRLVQAAMRGRLTVRGEIAATLERVIRRLVGTFPKTGYRETSTWPRCAALLPHVLVLRELIHQGSGSAELAELLNNAGSYLHGRGRYGEAEPLFKEGLAIGEKSLGREHPDLAAGRNNLALLYSNTGRYAEAEPLFQEALAVSEKSFGREHPDVAIWLNNLANLYSETGRYAEAEPLFKEALAIGEKSLGRQHPYVGTWLNSMANLYYASGRYAEAETLFQEALAIAEKSLGKEHPDVASRLNNLANLYSETGRYAEAEALFKEALAASEKNLGREHPEVATWLNNLANLYYASGRYSEAETLFREALDIGQKSLGCEHPDFETYLVNLSCLLGKLGRYEEAEALRRTHGLE